MDYNNIKILVEKYWRCETSPEEEKILREFFSKDPVPEDLKPYTGLFRFYNSVCELESLKSFSPEVLIKSNLYHPEKSKIIKFKSSWIYRAAAVVILILSVIVVYEKFISVKKDTETVVKDTFDNPEDALKEAKSTLLLVSRKLNKGEKEAYKISAYGKTEDLIRKPKN